MITIAMVLKTGGNVYNYHYVNALVKSIRDNVSIPYKLICLTDNPTGIIDVDKIIALTDNYSHWWSKIELFKPHQFDTDQIFYIDLDTVIIKSIDNILKYNGDFCGLNDLVTMNGFTSGLMSFQNEKHHNIYEKFKANQHTVIVNCPYGDQQWISQNLKHVDYFQDIFPKQIVSFKQNCLKIRNQPNSEIIIPNDAKIICFHGNPRLHTIEHNTLKKYWPIA